MSAKSEAQLWRKSGRGFVTGKPDAPEMPEMSAAETALLVEQTKALRAQQQVTAFQFHYNIEPDGTWRKMSDSEWYNKAGETERKQFDAYKKQLGQYNMAMEGELPLTKGMQAQKEEEFKGLKGMGNISGGNLEEAKATDTIGAQRLHLMQKRWEQMKEQQRMEAMGLGGNLSQGQNLAGMGQMNPYGIANSQGFSAAMQPYQAYNMARNNLSNQYNQQVFSNSQGKAGMLLGMLTSGAYRGGGNQQNYNQQNYGGYENTGLYN